MSAAAPRTLLLDLGNTRIKWAWLSGFSKKRKSAGRTQATERASPVQPPQSSAVAPEHRGSAAAPELKNAGEARTEEGLGNLPFLAGQESVEGALACNVAGSELGRKLAALVRERLAVELAFVQAQASACGVTNAYANPANLGADRWAALVGAHALGANNYCIVDAGSTITVDLLLANGRHLGGYIAPGREMSLAAMAKGTADLASRLKDHSVAAQNLAPAADSAEAMEKGAMAAQLGLIRIGMQKLAGQRESPSALLLTGGGAEALIATGELPEAQRVPDLVLRGLAALALELPLRPE
ncbi:MAG: type III pantothenate kinase [Gammaproteobacteria bacterium]|nr:type III pantothenate kinase [Gammaproteobacteria bacterium]